MKLSDIAKAVAAIEPNHSILIYGPPRGGKTRLVGTAARIPEIARIFWFDGENGSETLLHMGLTEEEMNKITLFKIRDTKDEPFFIETMLKVMTSKKPIPICDTHGRVNCAACLKAKASFTSFCMTECTHNDLVVIDSGSALGDSAMAFLCQGKDDMFKPGWDEYGIQGKWLGDILTVIQQATYTNFVVITHEICETNDEKKDVFYPLMGTKPFSMKCAKYFGTVIYSHIKMKKHVAGSSSTYLGDRITGSRVNAAIEKQAEPDMRTILIEGGILKASTSDKLAEATGLSKEQIKTVIADVMKEPTMEVKQKGESNEVNKTEVPSKETFAERMARMKKEGPPK
jgi:hypothetical protein